MLGADPAMIARRKKPFRAWAGTVLTAAALSGYERVDSAAAAKKNIRAAIERMAARLGNTPTICRKCYVHPELLEAYLEGAELEGFTQRVEEALANPIDMSREEAALLALLNRRLRKDLIDASAPRSDARASSRRPAVAPSGDAVAP